VHDNVQHVVQHVAFVVASIAYWCVVGSLLERAFTARTHRKIGAATWRLDGAFVVVQYAVWLPLFSWLVSSLPRMPVLVCPTSLPWLVFGGVVLVIAGDVCAFLLHVAMHRVPLLWRFHRVHHTSTEIDWMAAHREHPVDGVLTMAAMNLPLLVVDYPVRFLIPVFLFRGAWAVFIHCNVSIESRAFRVVGLMFGDPVLHRAHHAAATPATNYGNLAPYLDVVFGTHVRPSDDSFALGCDGPKAHSYLQQMSLR
jgi:sterol desaturase/sphingolipid hydroxylase (fatty acid hydroxylase superfamily)